MKKPWLSEAMLPVCTEYMQEILMQIEQQLAYLRSFVSTPFPLEPDILEQMIEQATAHREGFWLLEEQQRRWRSKEVLTSDDASQLIHFQQQCEQMDSMLLTLIGEASEQWNRAQEAPRLQGKMNLDFDLKLDV